MSKAIFYKSSRLFVFCIATLLFMLSIPMTSLGDDELPPWCNNIKDCYEISVNVAANIINITSLEKTDHAVVVHTNQDYPAVYLLGTQIFVNNGADGADDCQIENLWQRMDSNGNLDISFQIDDLKTCEDYLTKDYEFNILRIEGVLKDDTPFWGESYMHIVGKQGPGK